MLFVLARGLSVSASEDVPEGETQTEHEPEGDEEPQDNVDVRVTELRARVSPQLEVVLPSGNFYAHFVTNFNNLEIAFNLSFSVLGNTLGGDLGVSYPIKTFTPYVTFFQHIDFENYFAPDISGGEIVLVPTEKYLRRDRGFDLGSRWEAADNFAIRPSVVFDEVFKGDLTKSVVLEEGVDIVPQTSFEYDSLRAEKTETDPVHVGLYIKSNFSLRYRDDFDTPVEADNRNRLSFYHRAGQRWFFDEEATLNYPLKIWRSDLATYYSLGGFETIRGYDEGSIPSLRFFLLSLNVERAIFYGRELRFKLLKNPVKVHQFRLVLLSDTLLSQDRIYGGAPVDFYSGAGGGISFTFSGSGSTHFQFKVCAAQALTGEFAPIVYLRSSLLKYETRIK